MKQLHKVDILTILVITLLGIAQGQVTVFYIIYLFWFQELIRTVVEFTCLIWQRKTIKEKFDFIKISFGSFFILFVYVVFIVLLFGFMLNWNNRELLGQNILVIMFRNWYFNINMILFLAQYIYFRKQTDNTNLQMPLFSRRHIILHVSIILGALIQLAIVPRFNLENTWASTWVILPFLLLKIFIERPK
ncbi:DUF6498-containing protein [Parapedobacter sp. 2B3]|uniref:DUF6498-containing protein n=1 Tax=Parapedobacter sp. 2B3 TaxID=3342381 RepID=UPI0035B5CFF9